MKKRMLIVCVLLKGLLLQAQDLHFSQFYEMPLLRNPALSGIFTGRYRVQSVYRNQWQSIRGINNSPTPFRTVGAGIEYKIKGYCMDENAAFTAGLQVLRDQAGDSRLTKTTGLFSVAYRRTFAQYFRAGFGIVAGPVMNTFSVSNLQWDDQYVNFQYSPTNPTNQYLPPPVTKDYLDWGGGLMFSGGDEEGNQWYLGGACYHYWPKQDNKINLFGLPLPRITINGGMVLLNGEADKIKFYADYMRQNKQYETIVGVIYQHHFPSESGVPDEGTSVSGGMLFRYGDAVIPTMNLHLEQFTVGMSYDFNVSRLSAASSARGGIELTLKYRGIKSGKKESCVRKGCPFDY